jgi:hypothetical protein
MMLLMGSGEKMEKIYKLLLPLLLVVIGKGA